jgi:hypothetical protein
MISFTKVTLKAINAFVCSHSQERHRIARTSLRDAARTTSLSDRCRHHTSLDVSNSNLYKQSFTKPIVSSETSLIFKTYAKVNAVGAIHELPLPENKGFG